MMTVNGLPFKHGVSRRFEGRTCRSSPTAAVSGLFDADGQGFGVGKLHHEID
jgi:hypothetical protein